MLIRGRRIELASRRHSSVRSFLEPTLTTTSMRSVATALGTALVSHMSRSVATRPTRLPRPLAKS